MAAKRTDWIVCHDGTQGTMAYAMECTRCGEIQKVALPITVNRYVAMARVFERDHARCKPGGDDA